MAKLSMCRICLANEIRMQSVTNTHLQEMYESLTFMPFETKDNRPQQVCYICCAKLKNCYQLRKLCLQSEELFTQMLNSDVLAPEDLGENLYMNRLRVTAEVHLSMGYVEQKHIDCDVNLVSEVFNDIEVKVEAVEGDHVPVIPTQTIQTNPEDTTFSYSKENANAEVKVEEIEDNDHIETVLDETVTKNKVDDDKITNKRTVFKLKEPKSIIKPVLDIIATNINKTLHCKHKLFRCDTCQKCFTYRSQLAIHTRLHTGKKPYQCNVCRKCFSQKSNLKRHVFSHTGEKRYQCDVCKKRFSEKVNLQKHILAHTGAKQKYQCDVCDKGLSEKRSLVSHMRLHMNEEIFQCCVCKKCYSSKRGLSRHFYTHTGQKNK